MEPLRAPPKWLLISRFSYTSLFPSPKHLRYYNPYKITGNRNIPKDSVHIWFENGLYAHALTIQYFSSSSGLFSMTIILAERCCWHHYFVRETEGPSLFLSRKHPILLSLLFDVARNHWTVRDWEEIHIPQGGKKYVCSIKEKQTKKIEVQLSAYGIEPMKRPGVKTTTRTLLCPIARQVPCFCFQERAPMWIFHWRRNPSGGAGARLPETWRGTRHRATFPGLMSFWQLLIGTYTWKRETLLMVYK